MKKLIIVAALVMAVFVAVPAHADMDSDLANQIDAFSALLGGDINNPAISKLNTTPTESYKKDKIWRMCLDYKHQFRNRDQAQHEYARCMIENGQNP